MNLVFLICLLPAEGGILWQFPAGGRIAGGPVLTADSTIVFVSEDRYLYALDTAGTLLWRADLESRPAAGASAGVDGTVYTIGRNGTLRAFNPLGKEIWKGDIGGAPASAALPAEDGRVITCTKDGILSAWSHTGHLHWRRIIGSPLSGPPALSRDSLILIPSEGGYLYAFDLYGGEVWRFLSAGKPTAPFPAEDTVACATAYGTVFLLDRTGRLMWNRSYSGDAEVLFLGSGKIYVRTGADTVRCISSSGEELWAQNLRGYNEGAAGCGDGVLLFGSEGVYAPDDSGRPKMVLPLTTGRGGWAAGPEGTLLQGGEKWIVSCFYTAAADLCGGAVVFSPGTAGAADSRSWETSVDYGYMLGVARGRDKDPLEAVIRDFETLSSGAPPEKIPPYTEEILRLLASGAVTRPVYDGKRITNDFPLIRARALELLEMYGTLETSRYLLSLMSLEWDSLVLSHIISALGALGNDGEGQVTEEIYQIFTKYGNRDTRIAAASLEAVERIILYNGGITSESAFILALSVFRGDYPRELRVKASELLMKAGK